MFIEFGALAGLGVLAALGFGRVFAGSGYVAPVVGAVLVPIVITIIGMYRRASAATTLLWSFAVFALYTTYAALSDTAPNVYPTPSTARQLAAGLTGGWAELLTISLPASIEPRPMVAVLALVWAGAAIAAEFGHRSRSAVAPVVPALVVYLFALGFGASQPRTTLLLPLAIAAVLLFVVLVHTNRWAVLAPAGLHGEPGEQDEPELDRPLSVGTSALRWISLGLPVIAVALGAAWLIVPRLPERTSSFDPRSLREQRIEIDATANPLDGLKGELTLSPQEPPVRFTLEASGPADDIALGRVRLAVLDRFDGAGWSSSEVFTKAGSTLPRGPDQRVRTELVEQQVAITSATGPWLPAADRPRSIELTAGDLEIGIDPATGVLIGTGGDLAGARYTVRSEVARPTNEQLAGLRAPELDKDLAALTDVANMPAELRELAERLTAPRDGATDAATPYARLTRLQNALADGYGYSEDVPSGSSYGRLVRFLTKERAGYAEQFAAAFATMARSFGFPTRLVYGYLTTDTDPATGTVTILTDITSRQAHVWPEVLLGDGVWVAFEPTPPRVTAAPPQQSEAVADTLGGGVVTGEASTDVVNSTGGGTSEQRADHPALLSTPVLAAATLILVVVMVLASLIAFKRIRRHRRRNSPSTTDQVLGAWAEVTDRLLEIGVGLDRSMTAKEVAQTSAPLVSVRASERLDVMAPLVTVALYSPEPPSQEGAAEMWAHVDAFQREVLEGKQWYQGTVALLNPRPLLTGLSRR